MRLVTSGSSAEERVARSWVISVMAANTDDSARSGSFSAKALCQEQTG